MKERYIISDYVNGEPVLSSYMGLPLRYLLEQARETGIISAFTELQGCYKGQDERSFLVEGADDDMICKLLHGFQQECALSLNKNRGLGLLYPDGMYIHLGQWTTSIALPPNVDSYSFHPENELFMYKM
jgi:hypothetical protein